MIPFDWYQSFLAVYRAGTVTGAAEARGLTQPAVSQHIAALEATIGVALFTRTPRRMLPTERGKTLYNQVVQSLETLEQVSRSLRHAPEERLPLLRLGTPREYFAEVALVQLRDAQLRVWIQFGTTRPLLEALVRGELDLVIATERLNIREVEYRKLQEERFILVGGPNVEPPVVQLTTVAQRAALATWLATQPWVSYGTDLPIIRRFWRQCLGARPMIEPVAVIPDLLLLMQAVTLGYGVSVLPSYLCAGALADRQLVSIWDPPEPVTNDLLLAYRKSDRMRVEITRAIACMAAGLL